MVYYLKLQHEMSFLTRFLQNLLSCSYFTENLVRKSREVDSTAPPTLIAFLGYEVNSQSLLQRKVAQNLDSQLATFSKPLSPRSSSHRPGRWLEVLVVLEAGIVHTMGA